MRAAERLHVERVTARPADYGAAYRLMFREALRSPFIRRRVIRSAFLVGLLSVLAGCAAYHLFEAAKSLLRGRSAWPDLGHAVQWLPVYLAGAIAFGLLCLGWRIGRLALLLRCLRREAERSARDIYEYELAWNAERFGVIVESTLHAWPIMDLQAGDSSATHLFTVIPGGGNLIPIPLDQVDPDAADQLRGAMAEAGVPELWTRLEREMFLTVKKLQAPGVDEVFS